VPLRPGRVVGSFSVQEGILEKMGKGSNSVKEKNCTGQGDLGKKSPGPKHGTSLERFLASGIYD